jgi:hypothetical protein
MKDTGLFLPIRIYESINHISTQRDECEGYIHSEYFVTAKNYIPPFQVPFAVSQVRLVTCGDKIRTEGTVLSLASRVDDVTVDGVVYTYTSFTGSMIAEQTPGLYMLVIAGGGIGGVTCYSDPFYMADFKFTNTPTGVSFGNPVNKGYTCITYRSVNLLGNIYFGDTFFGLAYVAASVEKPTYPFINETRQDHDGNEHHVFQRWEKRRRIRFKGVESMADAMSMLPLMERVYVSGDRVYDAVTNITWEDEYSCLADIEITFLTKKVTRSF